MADESTRLLEGQAEAQRVEGTLNDAPEGQKTNADRWESTNYAKRIVVQEYDEASKWRATNHDHRWDEAERLYIAEYPQLTWPGSRVPKSSLGVPITFEQIEAMKPRIVSGLFSDDQWFEMTSRVGEDPKMAAASGSILDDQFSFSNPREQFRRAVGSSLLYGNGIMELYWDRRVETKQKYLPKFVQKKKRIFDPITGQWHAMPTGEFDMKMVDQTIERIINRPSMRYVSLRDFYIDPHAPSVVPKEARFTQKRIMMTIQDIEALRDVDGFEIPGPGELRYILNNMRDYDPADQSRQNANAANRVSTNPSVEYTADAAIGRVEVIIRWSNDRLVWVIGKALAIYNHPNPYGFIPHYNIFYADLIDRFYGLSIADVVEGEQRFQAKLVNTRLDELSLAMDPPTVTGSGKLSTYELRYRPGNVARVDDVQKDIQRQFPQNVTQQAYMEVQQSDIRVQRITGQNESAMQGVPTAQNPMARSAAGANMMQAASMSRIIHTVENAENLVFEPMIVDAWELNKLYLDPKEMMTLAAASKVDPAELFTSDITPRVRAGSRMMSKQVLAQMFPMVMQAVSNGGVLQQLSQQGQTVDWSEMFRILFDSAGYTRRATIIRKMNPDEQKAYQQQMEQQNQAGKLKFEMQDKRMGQLAEMQSDKSMADLVREAVKTMLKAQHDKGIATDQNLVKLLDMMNSGVAGGEGAGGGAVQ
jgi:hypothetical protein